jgi:GDPmannose 4,6-dehydratase
VSFSQPLYTSNITGIGVTRMLDEIKKFNKKIKFYQASSSELYGSQTDKTQNELTNFKPSSPYAISKLYGFWMTNMYRKSYDMYTVNGILFNHESPLRGLEFVTRKISNGVAKISLGLTKNLNLGNMDAKRDWGYAPEFVEGMWLMLQQKTPDDYVLSTSENHSVKEFVDEACKIGGISTTKIKSTKDNLRPFDLETLKGDNKKAIKKLGWKPKTKFKKLVKIMVEEDISRWERWLKGEQFPWDAVMADQEIIQNNK